MSISKDLFDDSTMSFGEHLEILRVHLWKAIIGMVICVIGTLYYGDHVIRIIRTPIDEALVRHGAKQNISDDVGGLGFQSVIDFFQGKEPEPKPEPPPASDAIVVNVSVNQLAAALHTVRPEQWPAPEKIEPAKSEPKTTSEDSDTAESTEPETVAITLNAPEFARLRELEQELNRPVTLNVQEAFMTYLKVSVVAGFVVASPWIFYQIWLFVAAGLYPHERKYVYIYLPLSLGLFLFGAYFCFELVFPFVLDFLLRFNHTIAVQPQIRLSEWISFAIMLPLMFGLSFQLPLVMLLLERLSIFEVADFQEKRRMAILIIAIVSMMLTPADPMSMLLMMFPLVVLYELGIVMCRMRALNTNPVQPEAT